MKEVALITLHGMGERKPLYYEELEKGLRKRLAGDWDRVSFQTVYYAPILQDPQDVLWNNIKGQSKNKVRIEWLRKFFLFGFGDAGSLEHSAHKKTKQYIRVERKIQKALRHAYLDFDEDKTKPVVVIAQSLGCQVISNYLWDAEHGKHIFKKTAGTDPDELEFLKLKSIKRLYTTGCNIPLFVSGLDERVCFTPPNDDFRWNNYYDPQDVLGWPLKQLGTTYKKIVKDHPINVGGPLTSWNPFSHLKYWSDKNVLAPLANSLQKLLP